MSRIGKQPIPVPSGVNVTVTDGLVSVAGTKGNLSLSLFPGISAEVIDNQLLVSRTNEEAKTRAFHGLAKALLNNLVKGVSTGFTKQLELNGVGYRVALNGNALKLSLGFSHPVDYKIPEGISIAVEQNVMTITGIDAQKVGQVAAEIRSLKKPEPYKGKGIKYVGERIIRKSGKSGKEKA